MKTYLSVDIDFWNDKDIEVAKRDLNELLHSAKKKRIPMVAVMNHQQLTRFVDKSRARQLVNIDTHSDLNDVYSVSEFNCGTWVSFIKWRHRGTYRWIHMKSVSDGECSWESPVFMDKNCTHALTRPHMTDWKKIARRKVKKMPNVRGLLRNCVNIGFVMSPAYSDGELVDLFRRLVQKYNIRYIKGVKDEEWYHADRKPTFRRMDKCRSERLYD